MNEMQSAIKQFKFKAFVAKAYFTPPAYFAITYSL